MWLGGFQDPGGVEPAEGWRWVTGEPWGFSNWQPGEPNDQDGEDVLGFGGGIPGQWNDFSAGRTLGLYLLEAEGCPVHYTWDFGDGQVAADAGPTPRHTYTQAGTFTVALTVTDALGRPATASTTVTVRSVPMLRDAVEALDLPHGIENSLLAKLRAAGASIEGHRPAVAASQLGAFVAEVRAQSGKAIAAPDAAELIDMAEAMQRVLTR